jgi:hypothetical protein
MGLDRVARPRDGAVPVVEGDMSRAQIMVEGEKLQRRVTSSARHAFPAEYIVTTQVTNIWQAMRYNESGYIGVSMGTNARNAIGLYTGHDCERTD